MCVRAINLDMGPLANSEVFSSIQFHGSRPMAVILTGDNQLLLSPQNDLIFKILFGSEKTVHLLSSLISALTGESYGNLLIQNPFLLRNYPLEKEAVLDINVKTEQGYQIFLEMQRTRLLSIPERMLFYWAKTHATQTIRGKDYFSLKKTIGICILGFPLYFHDEPVSCFQTLERREHERLCDTLDLYFFQLGNTKYPETQNITNDVWAWRTFLGAKTEEEMIVAAQASEAVNEAFEVLKGVSRNKEIQAIYEAREKFLLDQATREREAREEGKQEGRIETLHDIVSRMNDSGIALDSIAAITGLSPADIREIIGNNPVR